MKLTRKEREEGVNKGIATGTVATGLGLGTLGLSEGVNYMSKNLNTDLTEKGTEKAKSRLIDSYKERAKKAGHSVNEKKMDKYVNKVIERRNNIARHSIKPIDQMSRKRTSGIGGATAAVGAGILAHSLIKRNKLRKEEDQGYEGYSENPEN